ncbi:hypothetical protein HK102_003276, partial [Quaeritorhiza haematococci]
LALFDRREEGYRRVLLDHEDVEVYQLQDDSAMAVLDTFGIVLSEDSIIWAYVLDEDIRPNEDYPLAQSYIDVCLSGCLDYGLEFAIEFLMSTWGNPPVLPSKHRSKLRRKFLRYQHGSHYNGNSNSSGSECGSEYDSEDTSSIDGSSISSGRRGFRHTKTKDALGTTRGVTLGASDETGEDDDPSANEEDIFAYHLHPWVNDRHKARYIRAEESGLLNFDVLDEVMSGVIPKAVKKRVIDQGAVGWMADP